MAVNADGFLALWGQGLRPDLVGAAMDADGRRRQAHPVGVAGFEELSAGGPVLVPLGSGFLLQTKISVVNVGAHSEYFRVASDGRLLGRWSPAFALDQFGVVAATPRGDRLLFQKAGLEAVIVDDGGNVIRNLTMPYERDTPWHSAVAANDREFVLSWWDTNGVNVERIPTEGSPSRRVKVATAERFNGMLPFASAVRFAGARAASALATRIIYTEADLLPFLAAWSCLVLCVSAASATAPRGLGSFRREPVSADAGSVVVVLRPIAVRVDAHRRGCAVRILALAGRQADFAGTRVRRLNGAS